jgi:MFS family permease
MSLLLGLARLAAFAAVAVGMAADRIGRRRPLVAALTLLLVANGASALATGPTSYGVAQALARIGGASVSALGVVVLAEVVSPGVRAYAISFFGAAASLGAGLSVMTLPLANATELGWRLPHALPLLLILALPFLWRRIPESPLLDRSTLRLPWGDLLRGERRRRFLLVGIAGLLASAFSAVGLAFTTERLIGDLGYSAGAAVLVTVGGGTIGGAGFFVGGRLADGWGRRPTAILSLGLALVGGLALYRVTDPLLVAAAAAVSAFGSFAFIPAGGAHRSELFPTSLRAAAGSAASYLATVGSALGLLVGTFTIDRYGLPSTMTFLGFGMVAAALLTLALPETLGGDLTDT